MCVCVKPCLSDSIVSSTLTILPDRNLQVRLASTSLGPIFPSPLITIVISSMCGLHLISALTGNPCKYRRLDAPTNVLVPPAVFQAYNNKGLNPFFGVQEVQDLLRGTAVLNLIENTKHYGPVCMKSSTIPYLHIPHAVTYLTLKCV